MKYLITYLTIFLFIWGYTYLMGATHTVNNTNDSGPGSLRQAILNANSDLTSPRIINFAIASGIQVITPLTELPPLTASNVTIDGTTQPGWIAGHPVIVLSGSVSNFNFDGIVIDDTSNCTVQDIVINNGFLRGIMITNNTQDTHIYDCFIGTDQIGTHTSTNSVGIMVSAFGSNQNTNTAIGAPTHGNIISGNKYAGIFLTGNINNPTIQSNKIGTDITGQIALPNTKVGIAIGTLPINTDVACDDTQIGGSTLSEGNIISGNGVGILTGFQPITDLTITNNILGYNITGTQPIPNGKNIISIESIAALTGLLLHNNIS